MRKYSEPPWKLCHEHNGTFIRSANGGLVASLEAGNQEMRNVDGKLIEALPELLEALRAFLFQVNQGPVLERDAVVAQAREAYAMATR